LNEYRRCSSPDQDGQAQTGDHNKTYFE